MCKNNYGLFLYKTSWLEFKGEKHLISYALFPYNNWVKYLAPTS